MTMKTSDIRQVFIDYFKSHSHQPVKSSSLVPTNDSTLLFTNAGMVQFKDVFLGLEDLGYRRATSSQRCVRAGGKHNDLDNVGYTARHHTFFEMLGNFSFGDYFKEEAISFAWDMLTNKFGLPPERLWITVYEDDKEASKIWLEDIGIDPTRFSKCGEKDNFWTMGETGPCGPCSEIFYDHGVGIAGGPPGSPDEDGDRFVEIWNLVFMQYERSVSGELTPIPKPSVDTGMGLERLAAVLQGVHSNYDIDLFKNLIAAVRVQCPLENPDISSLRVVADHIRSSVFLCLDGISPANEGRGYVLRRIIRRALRHGYKIGITEPFFYKLVSALADEMGDAYPELLTHTNVISDTLKTEELRFSETLTQGMAILEVAISDLESNMIPGEIIFRLYDTYGFPYDLTADIARERNLILDSKGFDVAMDQQKQRARAGSQFGEKATEANIRVRDLAEIGSQQIFYGYEELSSKVKVVGLYRGSDRVSEVRTGVDATVILDGTPFYAESGGQVGDTGKIFSDGNNVFHVKDTQKRAGIFLHFGSVSEGKICVGDSLEAVVDINNRKSIRCNHSATHLLHAALRELLGTHVEQKGSLVDHMRLRFDFSHPKPLTKDEIAKIEYLINQNIRDNCEIISDVVPYSEAIKNGAMALFGEKYGDEVRVLSIGEFSTELCGGTHASRTGDIGALKVISESGVASGVRRIECITGEVLTSYLVDFDSRDLRISGLVKSSVSEIENKIALIIERNRILEKEAQSLRSKLAGQSKSELADSAISVNGILVVAHIIDGADLETLRTACDDLKSKHDKCVVVLAAIEDSKIQLIAGISKVLTKVVKAGDLVNYVAEQVGGKGGGRPDMAQAGGTNIEALPSALASVESWIEQKTS
jgi:alanyl-tRNA synthetase